MFQLRDVVQSAGCNNKIKSFWFQIGYVQVCDLVVDFQTGFG